MGNDNFSKTYDDGYNTAYEQYDDIFKNGYDNGIGSTTPDVIFIDLIA